VPADEVRAAFHGWCHAQGIMGEMNPTAFGLAMSALGYQRKKVGGNQRYLDIALVSRIEAPPLRLAVDNATRSRRALGDMRAAGRST
jgi:hypothetical protein